MKVYVLNLKKLVPFKNCKYVSVFAINGCKNLYQI